jgi:hypothetical protein
VKLSAYEEPPQLWAMAPERRLVSNEMPRVTGSGSPGTRPPIIMPTHVAWRSNAGVPNGRAGEAGLVHALRDVAERLVGVPDVAGLDVGGDGAAAGVAVGVERAGGDEGRDVGAGKDPRVAGDQVVLGGDDGVGVPVVQRGAVLEGRHVLRRRERSGQQHDRRRAAAAAAAPPQRALTPRAVRTPSPRRRERSPHLASLPGHPHPVRNPSVQSRLRPAAKGERLTGARTDLFRTTTRETGRVTPAHWRTRVSAKKCNRGAGGCNRKPGRATESPGAMTAGRRVIPRRLADEGSRRSDASLTPRSLVSSAAVMPLM